MEVIELFRLFGSVLIDDRDAINALNTVDKKGADTHKSLASSFDKIGTAMVAGIGVGVAALGGMIVKSVMASDNIAKAVNGIEAATGRADGGVNKFKDSLMKIYSNNFGDSYDDIATAMSEISKQTNQTGDALEKTTQNALMMRDTFGFEVIDSVRAANMMMETFGVTSDEAYTMMAQGAQSGADKNGDMLDTINEYSPAYQRLGLSSEEMMNSLINGANSGTFSVDKLGDSIKEFEIRTKDGSGTTKDAFTSLGLDADATGASFAAGGEKGKQAFKDVTASLFAMTDPMEQNRVGVELFGTQWEDLGPAGVKALTDIQGETSKTASTLDDINNIKYESFGEAMTGIGRQLETGLFVPLGEKILPKLNEFAQVIQDNMPMIQQKFESAIPVAENLLNGLVTAFTWVKDNINTILPVLATLFASFAAFQIISGIVAVVTTLSAAYTILTAVTGVLALAKLKDIAATLILNGMYAAEAIAKGASTIATGAMTIATGAATAAQWLLNAALTANPIGIIIALVIAFVAGLIYLWKTNEGFRNAVIEIWEAIKGAFLGAWEAIKTAWAAAGEFFQSVWGEIVGAFNAVGQWFSSIFTAAQEGIKSAWSSVVGFFQGVWDGIVFIFNAVVGFYIGIFQAAWSGIMFIWDAVIAYYQRVWDGIVLIFSVVGTFFSTVFQAAWDGIVLIWSAYAAFYQGIWDGIVAIFSGVTQWFTDLFKGAYEGATGAWSNFSKWNEEKNAESQAAWANFSTWMQGKFQEAWDFIVLIWNYAPTWFADIKEQIWNAFAGVGDSIVSTFNSAIEFLTGLPARFLQTAKDAMQSFWDGIIEMKDKIVGGIGDVANAVIDKFKELFGIHSPSRVMFDLAGNVINGFINGLNADSMLGFIEGMVKDALKAFGGLYGIKDIGANLLKMFGITIPELGNLLWPTIATNITSEFGYRSADSTDGVGSIDHGGVDIGASYGDAVSAVGNGTVTFAGDAGDGYGNKIIMDLGNGIETLFGHLSAINVAVGQAVAAGEKVGEVGSTGNSTGPHLHYGVYKNGVAIDPMTAGIGTSSAGGSVGDWIRQAMAITGVGMGDYQHLYDLAMHESTGNPNAYNESGASGLLQTKPGTFAAYAGTGKDIWNPVDNAVAAINYMLDVYKDIQNVPFGGYANGTPYANSGLHWVGEKGPELVNFKGGESVYTNEESMRISQKQPAIINLVLQNGKVLAEYLIDDLNNLLGVKVGLQSRGMA